MSLAVIAKERIVDIVYAAIGELNETLPDGRQMAKSPATPLFGAGANLDSLGLVSLVMRVEKKLQEEANWVVTLVDEKAMSQRRSPFLTVGTLVEYIATLIEGEAGV